MQYSSIITLWERKITREDAILKAVSKKHNLENMQSTIINVVYLLYGLYVPVVPFVHLGYELYIPRYCTIFNDHTMFCLFNENDVR